MKATISFLLPTRGRPRLAERFLASVISRSDIPSAVEAILYVDEDDPDSLDIRGGALHVVRIVGPKMTMGTYNMACLARASGDIVILANDDMVVRTQGWDSKIRQMDEALPDKIYLAYPDDCLKGRRLSTFPILSRRTCELLTEPFPTLYNGAFIDYHLMDVFMRLRACGYDRFRFLQNVVFEHLHYRTGKATKDETYTARSRFADDRTFLELAPLRAEQSNRLLHALKEPGFRGTFVDSVELSPKPNSLAGLYFSLATDAGLPIVWRLRLLIWILARFAYKKMTSALKA